MRTWINIRERGERWEVACGPDCVSCRTRVEAETLAQELARRRWCEDNVLMGVRQELEGGAPGAVTLYGP